MHIHPYFKNIVLSFLIFGLSMGSYVLAANTSQSKTEESRKQKTEVTSSVQSDVESQEKEEVASKRKALVKEALTALSETKKALKALEDNRPKDALKALAEVTGQLEIIVSRDPNLAFVPIDVEVTSHDIYADLETIKKAKEEAENLLEDGKVQEARVVLSGLASEMVVNTISIPLATYPDAIKAVVPLIDQGKIEEAKSALQAALQTLVVTNTLTIPLPILRAEALVQKADELAKKLENPELRDTKKSEETDATKKAEDEKFQKELISVQLQNARKQLEMAEALGYGVKEDRYKEFQESIENIEKKVHGKESTTGVFVSLKQSLSEFKNFLFNE
ncbi:MAG: hypothetical protein NPIRA02_38990 [Nitrospirales bacterium]|nr:MAG: hypothetical protein NPIRA02_38990 [Nitrospirales bacterium]